MQDFEDPRDKPSDVSLINNIIMRLIAVIR